MQPVSTFNPWHLIWTGMLTLLGFLLKWNLNQLTKQIDDKANKTEVTNIKEALENLRKDRAERDERSEAMHAENRQRLDRILEGMAAVRRLNMQDDR
jgi:hypothetical protein